VPSAHAASSEKQREKQSNLAEQSCRRRLLLLNREANLYRFRNVSFNLSMDATDFGLAAAQGAQAYDVSVVGR
jgi:hypothetical protein